MRDAWLPLGLIVLVGAAAPLACGQAFELSGSASTGASGTGGGSPATTTASGGGASTSAGGDASTSTSAAGSGSASTGSGMGSVCTSAADCTGTNTACGYYFCLAGHCALHQAQPDGDSYSQLYGDCHVATCKQAKLVPKENKTDVYDDGNPCTEDTCDNGNPVNTIKAGLPCGATGVCNPQGVCVECTNGNTGNCGIGNPVCQNGHCSPGLCTDGFQDNGESDKDCGGKCAPCDDGKYCEVPTDCASGVCMKPGGENKFKCTVPSCSDMVKNGQETDVDCGGPDCSGKCPTSGACHLGSDCADGVCQSGSCKAPTCTDGVMNGAETGVDCGVGIAGCPACHGP